MSNYVFRFDNGVYDGSKPAGQRISGSIIIDGKKCKISNGTVGNCIKSNSVCGTETETDEVINDDMDQIGTEGADTSDSSDTTPDTTSNTLDATSNAPDTTTTGPLEDLPVHTSMDQFMVDFNAKSPPGITLMT